MWRLIIVVVSPGAVERFFFQEYKNLVDTSSCGSVDVEGKVNTNVKSCRKKLVPDTRVKTNCKTNARC